MKALTSDNGSPFHAFIFTVALEHLSFSHLVLDTDKGCECCPGVIMSRGGG